MLGKIKKFARRVKRSLKIHFFLKKEEKSIILSSEGNGITNALLLCHALEKGMGIRNVKTGYGKEKALNLIKEIEKMQKQGLDDTYAYRESVAVVQAYLEFHQSCGIDITPIKQKFEKLGVSVCEKFEAGYKLIDKINLNEGMTVDFRKLIETKHSMRMSSFETITEDEIQKVIELSAKAPSACNRQPCRIYYSLDDNKNKVLGRLVPGNKAFAEDIKYYCVVTSDRACFSPREAFQWYVNGGIFITYLTLSMHSMGIGSCIFQWPDFFEDENELRKVINCKPSEAIIAIIGYGKYPDEMKCICAYRKDSKEIACHF